MFTDTYGIAPANTTLTIRYLVGGGLESNVSSGTLTNFDQIMSIVFVNPNISEFNSSRYNIFINSY
jgi:hypothetical protein